MKLIMKKIKSALLVVSFFTYGVSGQTQIGLDIDSEAGGDALGYSVSMPDYLTVGSGAPWNDGNGNRAGHVRIYNWNGSAWVQKGLDIDGEAAEDQSGYCISMPDANTVAIGAPYNRPGNTGAYYAAGHVRIYNWNGNAWVQKGSDIDGQEYWSIGEVLSMPDANTIAIGAPDAKKPGSGADVGRVMVYSWNGTDWVQKGAELIGDTVLVSGSWFDIGKSVHMPNANTLAIGAWNTSSLPRSGLVRVYEWDGVSWIRKGQNILGESIGDHSGRTLTMPDENTIAIGADYNGGNGVESGHVRIHEWNGTIWVQKGLDIDGEAPNNYSGYSLSMPSANTIAIGAIGNFNNNGISGQVRIYDWDGNSWVQKGVDIDGEHQGCFFGSSVSMPDENHISIGGRGNYHNGTYSGHVRVYTFSSVTVEEVNPVFRVSPNPANSHLIIETDESHVGKSYNIFDFNGKKMLTGKVTTMEVKIDIEKLPNGQYHFELESGTVCSFIVSR